MQSLPRKKLGWILFRDLAYTKQSLEPLAGVLEKAGCQVILADLPGEGVLAPDHGAIRPHDYIRAARTQTLRLMASCQEVFVMGHGMGGLLALQMAEELPVMGCVAAAPSLALPTKFQYFGGLIARGIPYQPHGDEGEGLPGGAREKAVPTAALPCLAEMAMRVLADADAIRCRTRILVPERDAWSDPAAARRLASTLIHGRAIDIPGDHACLAGEAGDKLRDICLAYTRWRNKEEEDRA